MPTRSPNDCTLGGNFKCVQGRKSFVLGVWAAPETFPKGGGASPPTFLKGLRGLRGRPDPSNDRSPILQRFQKFIAIQSAATPKACQKLYSCWASGGVFVFVLVVLRLCRPGNGSGWLGDLVPGPGVDFGFHTGPAPLGGPSSPCHGSPGDHKAEDTHLHTNLCYNTLCVNTANADVAGGLVRGEGGPDSSRNNRK